MNKHHLSLSLATLVLALLPTAAMAHVGTGSAAALTAGLAHPLGGADHLLAMLAVGLWAALMGGRAQWAVPVAFVAMLVVGGALGIAGVTLPFVEAGILISLLVAGLFLAGALRLSLFASTVIAAGVALLHGHAHGTEMPLALNAVSYSLGFALSCALLLGAGIASGVILKKFSTTTAYRTLGIAISAAGLGLAIS